MHLVLARNPGVEAPALWRVREPLFRRPPLTGGGPRPAVPVGAAWEDVFPVQKHALLESQKKLASEIERLNTRLQEKKTELLDEALILEDSAGERTAPLRPPPLLTAGHRPPPRKDSAVWDRIEAAERQRRAAERQL